MFRRPRSNEIWAKADNLTQRGPARLVTYSYNAGHRNITLGQDGTDMKVRIRTAAEDIIRKEGMQRLTMRRLAEEAKRQRAKQEARMKAALEEERKRLAMEAEKRRADPRNAFRLDQRRRFQATAEIGPM